MQKHRSFNTVNNQTAARWTPREMRPLIEASDSMFLGGITVTCSHFGCGRVLTITEQLAGSTCIGHSGISQTDATMVVKIK